MTLTTGDWNVPPPTLSGRLEPHVSTELPSLSGELNFRFDRFGLDFFWLGLVRG